MFSVTKRATERAFFGKLFKPPRRFLLVTSGNERRRTGDCVWRVAGHMNVCILQEGKG